MNTPPAILAALARVGLTLDPTTGIASRVLNNAGLTFRLHLATLTTDLQHADGEVVCLHTWTSLEKALASLRPPTVRYPLPASGWVELLNLPCRVRVALACRFPVLVEADAADWDSHRTDIILAVSDLWSGAAVGDPIALPDGSMRAPVDNLA